MAKAQRRETICAEVVSYLKEARKAQGISMEVLAAEAGLSQSMISLLERDLRNPTLDTLLRISHVPNLDLGVIITKAQRRFEKRCENLKRTECFRIDI